MDLVLNRKDYYSRQYILYNIILQLKNRYFSVRRKSSEGKTIVSRYYQGYSIDLIKDSLIRNNVLVDTSAKIYFDLSTWKNEEGVTPLFSFNPKKRLEQKKKFTGSINKMDGEYLKLIQSYDFAIDIDSEDHKKSFKDAKRIKEIFDKYKLPYSLRFSGSKGFHFVIDAKWITTKIKPINRPGLFGKVVANLTNDERIKNVDESIYDARRILKLAYSLCNNKGIEYVALPLDDEQFENWKYEDMKMANVMTDVKLFKRGLLERNHGLTEKNLKANVSKFLKDYK